MTDVFLGVIAISVLAMAIGQIAAVVFAARAVRQAGERLGRIEETIRPIVANVQQISPHDAARATAIATAQVERAERLMDDVTRRVDETMTAVQDTILTSGAHRLGVLRGRCARCSARSSIAARARRGRARTGRRRPPPKTTPRSSADL